MSFFSPGFLGLLVVGPVLVAGAALASAFVFNRDPAMDAYAPYFFAAYGLGAMVHWLGLWQHRRAGLVLLAVAMAAALEVDWRDRLALALLTALVLAGAQARHAAGQPLVGERAAALLARAATPSYALFLLHFPVLLLTNALMAQLPGATPAIGLLLLAGTWLLANGLALQPPGWDLAAITRQSEAGEASTTVTRAPAAARSGACWPPPDDSASTRR